MTKCLATALIGIGLVISGCQNAGFTFVAPASPAAAPDIMVSNDPSEVGRTQLAAANFGLAERNFREAVEKNPGDAASWIGLAAAYDNLRRFELADRAYAEAIRTGGETLAVINNLGYSYLLRGDDRRAMVQFKRALALDPTNLVIANNIQLIQRGRRPLR